MNAAAIVMALWTTGILFLYLTRYPMHTDILNAVAQVLAMAAPTGDYLARVGQGFAIAGLTAVGAALVGRRWLKRVLPMDSLVPGEGALLGGTFVLGLLSLLTLVLGVLGFWSATAFAILLGGIWIVAWIKPERSDSAFPFPAAQGLWTPVWMTLLVLTGMLYVLGAACPEIFYDSLHYHLAVPSIYEQEHRLVGLPTLFYASFISTVQMLWGFVHAMGSTFAAKAFHAGLALLLIPAYFLFSKRYFVSTSGWIAALFVLSMPMVALNATTAGTDVAGAFFIFVSAFALVRALENGDRRWFWLAGLLTGIAGSCKYPALPFIPIAAVLIIWERRRMTDAAHFLLAATLMVLPLFAKNLWLYGNPVYPFLGTSLGHPHITGPEWQQFMGDTGSQSFRAILGSKDAFLSWLIQPWTMTMQGSGTVGPLLLMGFPLLCFGRAPSLAFRTLRRYAIAAWMLWWMTTTVPRYCLPAVVLTAPLIAEALFQVPWHALLRRVMLGVFALGILVNLHWSLLILFSWQGWQVLSGRLPEPAYLSRMWQTYPTPPYEALDWMNNNLPADARVLFAGDSRSYYLKRRILPSSIPGVQPVVAWSKQSKSGAELAARMRAEGVTHIFLNFVEAIRTDSYHVFDWDAQSWAVFDDFWKHNIRFIWKKENPGNDNPQALYVFELASEADAAQPHPPAPNPFERWKPK